MARTRSPASSAAALALAALAALASVTTSRCAKQQCSVNSDCGFRAYCEENTCRSECAEDRDCADGSVCDPNGRCQRGARDAGPDAPDATQDTGAPPVDTGAPPVDTGMPPMDTGMPPMDTGMPPMDTGMPPMDTGTPPADTGFPPADTGFPPADTGFPPVDTGVDVPSRGRYLDPCTMDGDCMMGVCAVTSGGARFCSRPCTSRRDCGDGYLCAAAAGTAPRRCMPDDTGTPCDPRTAVPCQQYCYSTTGSRVAHCTRECASGADCPAGYACQLASGSTSVCVEVEAPCARGADCATSLCLPTVGCTSQCRTAADCPARLPGVTPYTCDLAEGVRVCNPPRRTTPSAIGYVAGADPMGQTCNATGENTCRSAVCDDTEMPPACVQACSPTGGCPAGWGCRPWIPDPMGTEVYLVCRRAGSGAIGTRCTRAADCATALCRGVTPTSTEAYCTRFCNDGNCPTGWRCEDTGVVAEGGHPVRFCTR